MSEQESRNLVKRFSFKSIRWIPALLLVVVAGGGLAAWQAGWLSEESEEVVATFVVPAPAPLTISITESGTIRSKEQVVIKSRVEGRATILDLVAEGTQVEEGDLLIQLDASSLKERLVEQEIRVRNDNSDFVRARENLEVVKNQAKADVAQAELDARFAAEDLSMYQEGEYPKKLKEMEARIALAAEELQRARRTLEGSEVLFAEKFISENELQGDELAAKKAELDLELAEDELSLFKEYTHQRRLDELNAAKEQADMALERAERKASANIVQAEADLLAKEAELEQQRTKLEKVQDQIDKTTIRAPRAGLVIYATSTQFSWRGNQDPLAEGQEVRERQELIHLPTTDSMIAEVTVPEAKVQILETGLPAVVSADALPGRTYRGTVNKIAPLPNATSVFLNPDLKVYDTEILLDGDTDGLRTGMSCTVEIIAARYDEALHVPVHAVLRHGRQPVVYVRTETGFEPKPVRLGLDDNQVVHITDGLSPGDVVMLTPPLDEKSAIATQDAEPSPKSSAEPNGTDSPKASRNHRP